MASTAAAQPSSEYPNWLDIPDEVIANILQRLRTVEIFKSARQVCTTWRRICKDPVIWKVIDMHNRFYICKKNYDMCKTLSDDITKALTKQAVDLSCGELIDISIHDFGSNDLLDHIMLRSSKLKRLCLRNCPGISGSYLSRAVKMVPQLEELRIHINSIDAKDIEVIGRNCPQLKSFTKSGKWLGEDCDDRALAIANNMPELRRLQLVDMGMTNNGLEAILNGCPHLQSLGVGLCYKHIQYGHLGKLYEERIKDLKFRIHVRTHYDEDMCSWFWDDYLDD